jgi:hypothetical protein
VDGRLVLRPDAASDRSDPRRLPEIPPFRGDEVPDRRPADLPLVKASLPAEQTPDEGPWRPLSEPEYDALSLRAKIRHQLILASDARSKAGPMFRNTQSVMARAGGEHIQASDMPDTWRRWTDIARGHEAEAARLRSYLHAKPSTDHARQQEAR